MRSLIWISYDLSVRGDYEGMYTWLDRNNANECGDSLAVLTYEYSGSLIGRLKKDIESSVEIGKKTRVYIIWRDKKSTKMHGRFIFGARKGAPWTGFGGGAEDFEDVEE